MQSSRSGTMWARWVLFLLLGLSLTGRSFAYLGIPPAKLFVGDLTLAAFVVLHPRKIFDPWIVALTEERTSGPCCLAAAGIARLRHLRSDSRNPAGFHSPDRHGESGFQRISHLPVSGDMVGPPAAETLIAICPGFLPLLLRIRSGLHVLPSQVDVRDAGIGWSPRLWPAVAGAESLSWRCCAWIPNRVASGPHDDRRRDVACRASTCGMGGIGPGADHLGYFVKKDDECRSIVRRGIAILLGIGHMLDIEIPAPQERGGNISSREIVARGLAAIDPAVAQDVTGSTHVEFLQRHHHLERDLVARHLG